MNGLDQLAPGLSDAVFDSQRCFRAAMQALSHPGTLVPLDGDLPQLPGVSPAAAGLLLSLLDPTTRIHLSASRSTDTLRDWLRFHTDCVVTGNAGDADFVWVGSPGELPVLAGLRAGDDFAPQASATVIVETGSLVNRAGWQLSGPGIRTTQALAVAGIHDSFVDQWRNQHAQFPCGVDLIFASRDLLCGLPRTTRIGD